MTTFSYVYEWAFLCLGGQMIPLNTIINVYSMRYTTWFILLSLLLVNYYSGNNINK